MCCLRLAWTANYLSHGIHVMSGDMRTPLLFDMLGSLIKVIRIDSELPQHVPLKAMHVPHNDQTVQWLAQVCVS